MVVDDQVVRDQRRAARQIARTMQNRGGLGAPVRRSLLLAEGGSKSPMSSLLSGRDAPRGGGGRGGRTRLALYLTLLWVLSGRGPADTAPHSSARPWRFWAELIGLAEPDGAGTRAVRAAARELHERGFVVHTPSDDNHHGATLKLLREDRTGADYEIPNPKANPRDRYLRIPEAMWTQGLLGRLTGPELAMYLIALDFHRTDLPEATLTFGQSFIRDVYGLGDSSRRAGLGGLAAKDVLWVETQAQDDRGERLSRLSPRNVYSIPPSWRPPDSRHRADDAVGGGGLASTIPG
jgi:hypothetical protein